ncbi:MAG TPA: TIR domain-containing protein [Acidobacteriota bacterium]|nr:TIR domain-containing protein [Acidobacteriota bacterium]HNT16954.1 TIR domain-containing protein [Acidobacteriota bacterium]
MIFEKHKTFISYHHENDEDYKTLFRKMFADYYEVFISMAVEEGDIDPNLPSDTIRQKIRDEYLRDTTVTVVLVGSDTWRRKHIDWEISSSIRDTRLNPRSGLLGILLPTYPRASMTNYNPYTIPPRLYDNVKCGYAKLHNWTNNPDDIREWIQDAFDKRNAVEPDISFPSFSYNKSGDQWRY